jgi:hypothetical protein
VKRFRDFEQPAQHSVYFRLGLVDMALEFKPEQERMIQEHLASGQFKSVDEALTTDKIRE